MAFGFSVARFRHHPLHVAASASPHPFIHHCLLRVHCPAGVRRPPAITANNSIIIYLASAHSLCCAQASLLYGVRRVASARHSDNAIIRAPGFTGRGSHRRPLSFTAITAGIRPFSQSPAISPALRLITAPGSIQFIV